MKKNVLAIATMLALSILAAAGSVHAQQPVMLVNIPFEFIAGSQTLPAGEYKIERALSSNLDILLLRKTDSRVTMFVSTIGTDAAALHPEWSLVFNRYGRHYFLSQVWTAKDQLGRVLRQSPREKELATTEQKHEVALLGRPAAARP